MIEILDKFNLFFYLGITNEVFIDFLTFVVLNFHYERS